MVRRWSPSPFSHSSEQHQQQQQGEDPISFYDLDSCFLDYLSSDFDPIKEWLVDPDPNPNPMLNTGIGDGLELGNFEPGHQDLILPASIGKKMELVSLSEPQMDPTGHDANIGQVNGETIEAGDEVPIDLAAQVNNDGSAHAVTCNDVVSEVCSVVTEPIKAPDERGDGESSEESHEESEDSSSEGSSSSSSSEEEESSSSDNEDVGNGCGAEKVAAEIEIEEGEINGGDLDEFILGSDVEEEVPKGPIKSKHEIEDLPPVPSLEVSLEPHHQTLPVGFVSSIIGNRVIVEGSEKHSPLSEGSVLWVTETRSHLGIVDEIFGPVKNPYYSVRYNSDKEVPPGIRIGIAISFVVDFANHILNEKSLYQKGYDASGMDDEEATDEVEFSDDEKEAEYRRSLRQNKRNTNSGNQESGFGKKKNNFKGAGFHRDKQSPHSLPVRAMDLPRPTNYNGARDSADFGSAAPLPSMMPAFPSQPQAFQMGVSGSLGNTLMQFNAGSVQGYPPQPHPMGMQGGGFHPQVNAIGIHGGFPPSPQLMAMQGGGPSLTWSPGQQFGDPNCNLQHQARVINNLPGGIMPYPQQQQYFVPYIGAAPSNFPWVAGLTNPSIDPSAALAGLMGQSGFNQVPFGCGNANTQGSSVLGNEQIQGVPPSAGNQGAMRPSSMHVNRGQFNRGRSSSSRGRRPYQGGGHHSLGRGGNSQQNS